MKLYQYKFHEDTKYPLVREEIFQYFMKKCQGIGLEVILFNGNDMVAETQFHYSGLIDLSHDQQSEICLNYAKELKRYFKRNHVTISSGLGNNYYDLFIRVSKSFLDLVPKDIKLMKHASTVNILVGYFQNTKPNHIGVSISLGGLFYPSTFDKFVSVLNSNQSKANVSMFNAELKLIIDVATKAIRLTFI